MASKLKEIQVQVTLMDEDYSSHYASISIPSGANDGPTIDAMRAAVPVLLEVVANARYAANEKAAAEKLAAEAVPV